MARVKSAIGIGTLLNDGLGDTIRVSLTEDPIYEVPVARELADKAMTLWKHQLEVPLSEITYDSINPFDFNKRSTRVVQLSSKCAIGGENTPAVIVKTHHAITNIQAVVKDVCAAQMKLKEIKIEGLHIVINAANDLDQFTLLYEALNTVAEFFVLELGCAIDASELETFGLARKWLSGNYITSAYSQTRCLLCGDTLTILPWQEIYLRHRLHRFRPARRDRRTTRSYGH